MREAQLSTLLSCCLCYTGARLSSSIRTVMRGRKYDNNYLFQEAYPMHKVRLAEVACGSEGRLLDTMSSGFSDLESPLNGEGDSSF
jgi:hypothetical protein